jgi:hypothetical protein
MLGFPGVGFGIGACELRVDMHSKSDMCRLHVQCTSLAHNHKSVCLYLCVSVRVLMPVPV